MHLVMRMDRATDTEVQYAFSPHYPNYPVPHYPVPNPHPPVRHSIRITAFRSIRIPQSDSPIPIRLPF
uniref:Uncharacterized protein n=1 Tax=Picea sitchensis TaxID=3332 RepID=A0A6B9XPK3_PICSI|nr:hypothetical protein Q903MT_gene3866 [Picea sitchensis]